ncbi:unnamed protein product [Paramecium pentaurelia]|uniref:Uncharacterized protein n=1 Tax=Paramecium pentaurelia TaxID=43138 RepID=A0A8S1RYW6_9CILI|nr:unnamed protein product [Paramecium pentaurelia]
MFKKIDFLKQTYRLIKTNIKLISSGIQSKLKQYSIKAISSSQTQKYFWSLQIIVLKYHQHLKKKQKEVFKSQTHSLQKIPLIKYFKYQRVILEMQFRLDIDCELKKT